VLRICLELGLLIMPRNLPKIGFLSSDDGTHLMCGNLVGIQASISDDVHLNPIICLELIGSHIV
jgi:hypothetical protein